MRARSICRAFLPLLLVAVCAVPATGRKAAAPSGEIVFASDRDWVQPGEVYVAQAGRAPRDVSRSPYADSGLAVAPHGDAIAFWSVRSGRPQVYLVRADGSHLRPVAGAVNTSDQTPGAMSFSPDGRALLVPRFVQTTSGSYRSELLLADVARATARRLVPSCGFNVSWSLDGRLIACGGIAGGRVSVYDRAGRRRFSAIGTSATWSRAGLAVADERGVTLLSETGHRMGSYAGTFGGWSPDGSLLALGRSSRLVLQTVGGGSRTVYAHRDWQPPVAFTPDGQALAFGTPDGARLAPVHGGPLQRLAGVGGSWSPDGRRYAYFAGNHLNVPGGTMAVMVGDRLGRHAQVAGRFPFDDHGSWQLGWLPDGQRLSYQDAVDSAGDDLYAVSADGSGIRRLTRDPRNQVDPAWARDGSELAYVQSDFIGHLCEGCPSTLWRAGPDLQSPEPLTRASTEHTGHFDAHPSWSPAGDAVAFTHAGFDSTSIAVTPVAGGQPTTVLTGSSGPAWSPDGTTLAFCDAHGIEGVAPTGGEVRLLLAAPDHDHPPQDVAWSPSGGMLAFTTDQGLYVAPADGSLPPRKVAALRASHPSFSPDGQWLAFAGGTQTRSVWGAPSQLDIYVVGVDGSDLHAITSTPYDDIDPAWRP